MKSTKRIRRLYERHTTEFLLTGVLLLVGIALTLYSPHFLTAKNLKNILEAATYPYFTNPNQPQSQNTLYAPHSKNPPRICP
jgi:hypothetical protein